MSDFQVVANSDALEHLFQESNHRPVVLFKHSNSCPISGGAYHNLEQAVSPISIVVIQKARGLSQEIEDKTGVGHESPQVIVLRNGKAVWSASHWNITAADVDNAVALNQ